MTEPTWVRDAVQAFGRQMGLAELKLNDQNAAGLNFENGTYVSLEYTAGMLVLSASLACAGDYAGMTRLLTQSHWAARSPMVLRTGYSTRTGKCLFAVRIPERDVSVPQLEAALRLVWERLESFRRATAA